MVEPGKYWFCKSSIPWMMFLHISASRVQVACNVPVTPAMSYSLNTLLYFSSKSCITTSTTRLKPSNSSSTVPPMPALAKLVELPTYTGFPVLRASNLDNRVAKSRVPPCVKRGVLNVSIGETRCSRPLALVLSQDVFSKYS